MRSHFKLFNLTDLRENQIEELKKFHKSYFDVDSIISTASELKYTSEIKSIVHRELNAPSDPLVRHFAKQVYGGLLNAKMMDYFTGLVKKSFQYTFADQITDRLKTALNQEEISVVPTASGETSQLSVSEDKNSPVIVTTPDELEGFYIIRAILRTQIDPARIVHRDAQTYFAVLLDDNNRKPLCRFYFNGQKKYISFLDEAKKETRHEIQSLNDIFQYEEELQKALSHYMAKPISN